MLSKAENLEVFQCRELHYTSLSIFFHSESYHSVFSLLIKQKKKGKENGILQKTRTFYNKYNRCIQCEQLCEWLSACVFVSPRILVSILSIFFFPITHMRVFSTSTVGKLWVY